MPSVCFKLHGQLDAGSRWCPAAKMKHEQLLGHRGFRTNPVSFGVWVTASGFDDTRVSYSHRGLMIHVSFAFDATWTIR